MNDNIEKSFVEIYKSNLGELNVSVKVSEDTVYLSLNQLSDLFERDKSVISRHLKNIFTEGELDKNSVVAKNATTALDGKTYEVEYYNLDAIISVGYRVNSKKGTEFRKWASKILKDHLIKGYSLNSERLLKDKISELQSAIDLMSKTLIDESLVDSPALEIIDIIRNYSKTWDLLIKYDEENLVAPKLLHHIEQEVISYDYAKTLIEDFKKQLNLSGLFGLERDQGLKSIFGNIMQSFGGQELYKSAEEKAAHLLYFVIKDHPFSDGNKRIGSLLFLVYLKKSGISSSKMNENTLTALALLTAESHPDQKDLIIKLIMNLIC